MTKLRNRMRTEVQNNLDSYLDSSRCFQSTLLAEEFICEDDVDEDDEDDYFTVAGEVAEWAVKQYNLNK